MPEDLHEPPAANVYSQVRSGHRAGAVTASTTLIRASRLQSVHMLPSGSDAPNTNQARVPSGMERMR